MEHSTLNLSLERSMQRTNVFVLPLGATLGGVTIWSINMAEKLRDLQDSAILLRHSEINSHPDVILPTGVEQIRCSGAPAYLATLPDVISYLPFYSTRLPATIVPNWSAGTYAACALLSLTQAPHFRTVGFAHTDELEYYKWLQYYEPIIHIFVAVSDEIGVKLKALLPHRESDILVRPYSVDVPPHLRSKSGVGDPVKLVYAGRLETKQKRTFDLLTLVKHLEEKKIDYRFRIIGEGSLKGWLQDQLKNLPSAASQRISLENAVPYDKMTDVWEKADICVLVSEYEGTSISMLEAMSCGCIPVSTKVSGTAAVISDGLNGFTVPIGDMSTMSQIIESLANDRNLLRKASEHAYLTASNRFSSTAYVRWFKEMVELAWERPPTQWPADLPILMPEIR